jgi:hypothetical protein
VKIILVTITSQVTFVSTQKIAHKEIAHILFVFRTYSQEFKIMLPLENLILLSTVDVIHLLLLPVNEKIETSKENIKDKVMIVITFPEFAVPYSLEGITSNPNAPPFTTSPLIIQSHNISWPNDGEKANYLRL